MVTVKLVDVSETDKATVTVSETDKATVTVGSTTVVSRGNMLKSTYDTQLREVDIFDYTNRTVDDATNELSPYDIDILLGM